jgi:hypothetical protein
MSQARVRWIAVGYMHAYKRLIDATVKAYGGPEPNKMLADFESQGVFVSLFETLNWLYAR